jgi:hypothetical protein
MNVKLTCLNALFELIKHEAQLGKSEQRKIPLDMIQVSQCLIFFSISLIYLLI